MAWDVGSRARWAPRLKRLDILSSGPDELLLYEQIDAPVVRDRDYVVRLRATARGDGPGGSFRIDASGASDPSRPVDPSHIRMTDLWSRFSFVPRAGRLRADRRRLWRSGGALPGGSSARRGTRSGGLRAGPGHRGATTARQEVALARSSDRAVEQTVANVIAAAQPNCPASGSGPTAGKSRDGDGSAQLPPGSC